MPGNQQGAALDMLGQDYAPIYSGVPFQPNFGFEGTPLAANPMMAMIMQPMFAGMMGKLGMSPMGMNDQNIYDTLQNQRFWRLQMDLQRQSAELDRQSWMSTMHGLANITGTPWGAEQMQAARSVAAAGVAASPYLTMIAPDLVDQMAGYRGSAAVMAGHMMMAGRYRVDPVTGLLGQDPTQVAAQAKATYQDIYAAGDLQRTQGISAGQLGLIYEGLSSRGLLGGSTETPQEAIRRLIRTDPDLIAGAADREGIQLPRGPSDRLQRAAQTMGLDKLMPVAGDRTSAEQLEKLGNDPQVADRLRTIDSNRVKSSLDGYLQAVNAVRDIFGDMGRPNAPMAELLNAMDALTNGSLSQMQPGRINKMVRMTEQMANASGLGIDNAMMIQQQGSQMAASLGLPPIFAVQAMQGAAGFGAAYKHQAGGMPVWGAMTPEQMTQLDNNLRVSAAGSRASMQMALALRVDQQIGGFAPGSDAARYVAALKAADTTGVYEWQNSAGQTESLNLSMPELSRMLTGAKTAKGQPVPYTASDLSLMVTQRQSLLEYAQNYNLGDVTRGTQPQDIVNNYMAPQMRGFLVGRLRAMGVSEKAIVGISDTAFTTAATSIRDMPESAFRDPTTRNNMIGGAIQTALQGTEAGRQLLTNLKQKGIDPDKYFAAEGGNWYGYMDEQIHNDANFSAFKGIANFHAAFNRSMLGEGDRFKMQQQMVAEVRTALAPLNRGGMIQRAVGYLQQLGEKDTNEDDQLIKMAAVTLGGVDDSIIRAQLVAPMKDIKQKEAHADRLAAEIQNMPAGPEKTRLIAERGMIIKAITEQGLQIGDTLGKIAVGVDEPLTVNDTMRAMNIRDRRISLMGQTGVNPDDFRDTAQKEGSSAADVAAKFFSSPSSIDRFGLAGVKQAQTLVDTGNKLQQLAATYTGGDMGRLLSGDFDATLSAADRSRVGAEVQTLLTSQGSAVSAFYQMQQQQEKPGTPRPNWDQASIDELSKMPGMTRQMVTTAAGMSAATVRDVENLKMLQDAATSAGDHVPEALKKQIADARAALGKSTGQNVDDLIKADNVYAFLRSRAAGLNPYDANDPSKSDPATVGKNFLGKYGVIVGDVDPDSEQGKHIAAIGQMLMTGPGMAIGAGLTGGIDYLAAIAKQGKAAGATDMDRIGTLSADYQRVLAAKGPDADKRKQAFRKQYGLTDESRFRAFEDTWDLQQQEGFDLVGVGGKRFTDDPAEIEGLLGRDLAGGGRGGGTTVNIPDKITMTITGKLDSSGNLTGTGTGHYDKTSAPSMNAVPIGGP